MGVSWLVHQKFVHADICCPLMVAMESLRCFRKNYAVNPGYVAKKPELMDLIQVAGKGFHIDGYK